MIHRMPKRAAYDRVVVVNDKHEGLYCSTWASLSTANHSIIPTIHGGAWTIALSVHGLSASRMLCSLKTGVPICITVTILDGLAGRAVCISFTR